MVHDQRVFTHGMYLPFCFFMSCPEPPMGISSVGSFPVWRFSNIFFQLFRCRNLALNRVFSYFLVVGMFLYLGGAWTPPMFVCPLYICTPQGCTHPHRPPCSSVHLHGFGAFACCGGLLSAFSVCWDTSLIPPLFGGAFPLITPPTLSCWFPVQCYSQGYWYLM